MADPRPRGRLFCMDCFAPGQRAPKTARPAPHPGPRCASHWRVEVKRRKSVKHDRVSVVAYGMSPGDWAKLLAFQDGRCALCRRATGKTKRLARDHRHSDGVLRGALCSPCNKIIGLARDDPEYFRRAANYLDQPPALLLGIRAIHKDHRAAEPEPDQGKYRTNDNTWKA